MNAIYLYEVVREKQELFLKFGISKFDVELFLEEKETEEQKYIQSDILALSDT